LNNIAFSGGLLLGFNGGQPPPLERRDAPRSAWEMVMKVILLSVLLCFIGSQYALAVERQIDPEQSTLTIHVGKSGLLSALGHEYTVTAPIADGTINDGASAEISFRVETARLTVLPEEHESKIQHMMQERVLESTRFPEIYFVSDKVQFAGEGEWDVSGRLTLHDETRTVLFHVKFLNGEYIGNMTINQTDFGIRPVSAGGGTVKVKNELKIDFSIKMR
jgi:polyisoprenoid-binding protein YceI